MERLVIGGSRSFLKTIFKNINRLEIAVLNMKMSADFLKYFKRLIERVLFEILFFEKDVANQREKKLDQENRNRKTVGL